MTQGNLHHQTGPLSWVVDKASHIKTGGSVLDLACGKGRHTRWLLDQGFRVMAVDINISGLADLSDHPDLAVLEADVENGPWPLGNAQFDGIVVTNYLWRPLIPHLLAALAPAGVLIYETFSAGNEKYGKPSNPDFLLQPGELKQICTGLTLLGFEEGFEQTPKPAVKQRICAQKD